MKKIFIITSILILSLPFFALSGGIGSWNEIQRFFRESHRWTGTQTFDNVTISDGTAILDTLRTNGTLSVHPIAGGATVFQVDPSSGVSWYGKTQIIHPNSGAGVIVYAQYKAGVTVMGVYGNGDVFFCKDDGSIGEYWDASTGNKGIGTTVPTGKLHIQTAGSGVDNPLYFDSYSATTANTPAKLVIRKSHSDTAGTLSTTQNTEDLGQIRFSGVNNSANAFQYGIMIKAVQNGAASTYVPTNLIFETHSDSAANSNQLVLNSTGNVGIDTTSPRFKLDVQGSSTVGGVSSYGVAQFTMPGTSAGVTGYVIQDPTGATAFAVMQNGKVILYNGIDVPSSLAISVAGENKLNISSVGLYGGGADPLAMLASETATATNPVFTFNNDLDTGLGRAAADQLSLIAGGVEGIRITEAGGAISINANGPFNEVTGGTSTFVITGNLDINSSANAAYMTAGRPIEINATASPIVRLPDMSSLSSVTNQVLFVDVTKAGNDSGVTVWSPTNKISAGLGSTYTSGDTIFVTTGNTGFVLAMKALNYGSGVTPTWKVWSCNADVVMRP